MEKESSDLKFPGLKWRERKGGKVPYWFPPVEALKKGYPVKSANLSIFASDERMLAQRCEHLTAQLKSWEHDGTISAATGEPVYDGTWGSLVDIYLMDPQSKYHKLTPGSSHPYTVYAGKLKRHIGAVEARGTTGKKIMGWFDVWSSNGKHQAAGCAAFNVLKEAVIFGKISGIEDCFKLREVVDELTFSRNKPRDVSLTADQVIAARKAAHAAGAPSRALTYALQYETTVRQWDIIGQWVPISDRHPSDLIFGEEKWIGISWRQIDQSLILRTVHGKTEGWTDARGAYDLKVCPMVMEELARIPTEKRHGPIIVNERTLLPYFYDNFKDGWKADFKAAGLPAHYWNRDMRASGTTEASKAGVGAEDRAKVSGHSKETNAEVYDRDVVEAHRRVMTARVGARNTSET